MEDDTRELLIMRHAKSAWDTSAQSDYHRPLAGRGERDAPRMGAWMCENGRVPDLIVSSPARRAQQTTMLVAEEFDIDADEIRWDERLYGAGGVELREVLNDLDRSDPGRLLIVGHSPGLEEFAEFLTDEELPIPSRGKTFPTAALAIVRLPGGWARLGEGDGELLDVVRPRHLA